MSLTKLVPFALWLVLVTAAIQILLWRDRRTAAREQSESEDSLPASSHVTDIPDLSARDNNDEKTDSAVEAKLASLE